MSVPPTEVGGAETAASPHHAPTADPTTSVVIIGTGLIGASIGCALSAAGEAVHLEDRSSSHALVAAGLGAGTTVPADPERVDLVVVAVPPRALPEVVAAALERFPTAAVTDVGSVKTGVLDRLWGHPELARYVGSHPMAGSQHSGPVTARPDLFVDRTWVITPHRQADPTATERVRRLAVTCGAVTVVMDVAEHDAAVARVSHLPQLWSSLLAGHLTTVPETDLRLAGQGLRDVTRIAGSDPDLWEQIVSANSAAVLAELHQVQARIATLIDAVAAPLEGGALRGELERGVAGTRRIPGKHGSAVRDYAEVVIGIPDAPGALARLFADVDAAGVNVEDISIEHDQNRQIGYLSLAVLPDRAGALRQRMDELGWDVRSEP